MAIVQQTIIVPARIQSFAGLPPGQNNIFPRARIIFEDTTEITLKAAGNTNTILWVCFMPPNFAYRMDTVSIGLGADDSTEVSQIEDLGQARLVFEQFVAANVIQPLESVGLISNGDVTGGQKVWNNRRPFTELFSNSSGASPICSFILYDNNAGETVAQDTQAYFSFLQYDIAQVVDVSVNAPRPVKLI